MAAPPPPMEQLKTAEKELAQVLDHAADVAEELSSPISDPEKLNASSQGLVTSLKTVQVSVRTVIPQIPPESFAVQLNSNAARESLEHTLMQTALLHRLLSGAQPAAAPSAAAAAPTPMDDS